MKEYYNEALAILQEARYEEIEKELRREFEFLNAEAYKIAVVGEFKTGKSTLLNRTFIKKDLLFTDLLEATSVPTEIRYGKESLLEIVRPMQNAASDSKANDDKRNVERIENPCAEDIKRATSGETIEDREHLAREIERVRLFVPSEALSGLVLFDTPGINTPNEAIARTTYEILPQSDLALFVKTAKGLSEVEKDFLRGFLFKEGITRTMIVVSYDPSSNFLDARERERVVRTIKAQLSDIGREYLPVRMVDLWEKQDEPSKRFFRNRIDNEIDATDAKDATPLDRVAGIIENLLGSTGNDDKSFETNKQRPVNEKKEDITLESFEDSLARFIRENVHPARMENQGRVLARHLNVALLRCDSELAMLGKNEEERKRVKQEMKNREEILRKEMQAMESDFRAELSEIRIFYNSQAGARVQEIARDFAAGFDEISSTEEFQWKLQNANSLLRPEFERAFHECSKEARQKIRHSAEKLGLRYRQCFRQMQIPEVSLDARFLARIPTSILLILDAVLFVNFGPFGPMADLLVRLAANYVPFPKSIMPVALITALIKNNIKREIREEFSKVASELPYRTEKVFAELMKITLEAWEAQLEEQLKGIRKGLESATGYPDSEMERKSLLNQLRKRIDDLIQLI